MKKFISIFLGLSLMGCDLNNDDNNIQSLISCGVDNVLIELDWLRQEVERRELSTSSDIRFCFITQAILNGDTVFIYQDCNPIINKTIPIFNCEGINLNTPDNPINFNALRNQHIIWQLDDFECIVVF